MKKETMLKAFTDISDEFLEEAAPRGYLPKKKPVFGWLNAKMLAGAMAVFLIAFVTMLARPSDHGSVNIPRPNTAYTSIEEAAKVTGFGLTYPQEYKGDKAADISVYTGSMIEIIYRDGSGTETMRIRKAEGSDDISGDYNSYAQEETLNAGGKTVAAKGENGRYSLLVWEEEGYSYSASFSDPLSAEEAADFAALIH